MLQTIYHGSEFICQTPAFGKGKPYNDYGLGFYTTPNKELAGEWATLTTGRDGYITEYTLDTSELNILHLNKQDVKHWLAILMQNRRGNFEEELRDINTAFCDKYLIDVTTYDVIIGWRADDSYFAFVEDFGLGFLSLENLQKAMRFGDLGQQVCLKSPLAFTKIQYVTHHPASAATFHQKAMDRDNEARSKYRILRKEINARAGTLITHLV